MKYILTMLYFLFVLVVFSLCKAAGDSDKKIEEMMSKKDKR